MTSPENLINADGTTGPHWPEDKIKEIQERYNIDLDATDCFEALNLIYSIFCEALRKNNASRMEMYIDLAKAYIDYVKKE